MAITYIKFHAACKAQGLDRKSLVSLPCIYTQICVSDAKYSHMSVGSSRTALTSVCAGISPFVSSTAILPSARGMYLPSSRTTPLLSLIPSYLSSGKCIRRRRWSAHWKPISSGNVQLLMRTRPHSLTSLLASGEKWGNSLALESRKAAMTSGLEAFPIRCRNHSLM